MRTTRVLQMVAPVVMAGLLALLGCGRHAAPAPKPTAPLPEWAPKNPSPEFLRAAKVLKPIPEEPEGPVEAAPPAIAALAARMRRTYPAAYEFFGTLTDEQVKRFVSTKQVRLPVKSLTAKQHAALSRWLEAYRRAMKGVSSELPIPKDYLVEIYKFGGAKDLSNVDAGFATIPSGTSSEKIESTHRVNIWLWVNKPDGGAQQFGYEFAQL